MAQLSWNQILTYAYTHPKKWKCRDSGDWLGNLHIFFIPISTQSKLGNLSMSPTCSQKNAGEPPTTVMAGATSRSSLGKGNNYCSLGWHQFDIETWSTNSCVFSWWLNQWFTVGMACYWQNGQWLNQLRSNFRKSFQPKATQLKQKTMLLQLNVISPTFFWVNINHQISQEGEHKPPPRWT